MKKYKKKSIFKVVMTHLLILTMLISLFPLYSLQSYAVDYPTALVNGSFEYPGNLISTGSQWWTNFYPFDISGHSAGSYKTSMDSGTIPDYDPTEFGWDTTSTGVNRLFEFGSDANSATADWGVKFVPDGSQFIELNAAEVSAAFQDIQTTPGQIIYWSLYQGGVWYVNKTNINNTMAVRIGTPDNLETGTMKDSNQTVYDQEWIKRTIYEVDNMTEVSVVPDAYAGKDSNKKELYTEVKRWTKYEGIYVVPEGQTLTRFAFASRAATDPESGNLLDGIVFRTATESEVDDLTSYKVTFDGNGSDGGSTLAQLISKDETQALTMNGYTRTGYSFAGWNTQADGNGDDYTDGASYTATADSTLYAKWLSMSCDISSFSITAPEVAGVIEGTNITLTVPFETDVTSLISNILISAGATVSPLSGATTDFTSPVDHMVTAEDGITTKTYTVTVVVASNADITLVANAKNVASNTHYEDMTQAEVTSETVVEDAIKIAAESSVNNGDIAIEVNKVSYLAPIAGTSANHAGINGKYEFTLTVQKGVVSYTTEVKQIVIVATPYVEITKYNISGKVTDETPSDVQDAIVKIMKGQNQVGLSTLTANDGTFAITDLLSGTYNLVISKGGSVRTKVITISNANYDLGTIELSSSKTNSIVEVKTNTPSIVVGGLDDQFAAPVTADKVKGITSLDNDIVTSGGSVEIRLVADKKDNTTSNASNIIATATSNGKTVGIFLDLSILKTVKNNLGVEIPTQSAVISELQSLIEVLIPLEDSVKGKNNYVIYRFHGSSVDTITTVANGDGEKLELVNNGTILKLTTKKFSTYAIAYTSQASANDNNPVVENKIVLPQITVIQSEGGKIDISIDKKSGTIIPEDGYVIADVIIDEISIGAVENYQFTDNNSHKIAANFVKETAIPYYLENGERVFVGMSAIIGNTYKYIAPKDVSILFGENIKNFKDNTTNWSKSSIDFITERELLPGTSQDLFSPKLGMTRAMLVTAIGKLYESSYGTISGISHFSDIDSDAYYGKYVAWANKNGIVTGIGNNRFAPERNVTREELAVIMLNFARVLDIYEPSNISLNYSDCSSISTWAIEGAIYCQESNLITGRENDSFSPKSDATRSEVAVVLGRFVLASIE
ncbi:S-layer homology domain-containing protein [Fusibacter bizertensis]|uniref:S-layer homology domain-containing protein n=1 Tax=Fusibacter bizertensis TaxID=1488331 RepID=A0ABT6NF93_9FIRM|nr:S-layer homology domain-containing protein [Fusibacter bizertensis]MDH8679081.1 S-layer homology domain-containing protein [Fusibacter bizertensis]